MLIKVKSFNTFFTYAIGMYHQLSKICSKVQIFNFGYLTSEHYIYVRKDVRIRWYFSKQKGAREQKRLGKSAPAYPYMLLWFRSCLNPSTKLPFRLCSKSHSITPMPSQSLENWRSWTSFTHQNTTTEGEKSGLNSG